VGVSGETLVGLCDVDDNYAAKTYNKFPTVPRFKDYRVMLDKLGRHVDAVLISTPDHLHFPMAMEAIRRGKHVYVQKPAVQTMEQASLLLKAARKHKVATQMGNQGHSQEGVRRMYEWIRGGALGTVKEVMCFTNRPIWPQGMKGLPAPAPVPAGLDWKAWQGGVTDTPYSPAYLPFKWRGWRAYGTGAFGDMACHIMDAAFWSLDLQGPVRVTARIEGDSPVGYPSGSVVTYEFSGRNGRPPVKLTWYDGCCECPRPGDLEPGRQFGDGDSGSCFVGDKASMMAGTYSGSPRIFPENKMKEMAPSLPPRTLPRIKGSHYQNWIDACKGHGPACSNFEYSLPFTQMVLIGTIAQRLPGQTLEWNGTNSFGGNARANEMMHNPLAGV